MPQIITTDVTKQVYTKDIRTQVTEILKKLEKEIQMNKFEDILTKE